MGEINKNGLLLERRSRMERGGGALVLGAELALPLLLHHRRALPLLIRADELPLDLRESSRERL